MLNHIVTTAFKGEGRKLTASGIILDVDNTYSDLQRVLAISPIVERQESIKVGDVVKINYRRYMVNKSREEMQEASVTAITPSATHVHFDQKVNFPIIKDVVTPMHLEYGDYKGECMLIYDADVEYVVEG